MKGLAPAVEIQVYLPSEAPPVEAWPPAVRGALDSLAATPGITVLWVRGRLRPTPGTRERARET